MRFARTPPALLREEMRLGARSVGSVRQSLSRRDARQSRFAESRRVPPRFARSLLTRVKQTGRRQRPSGLVQFPRYEADNSIQLPGAVELRSSKCRETRARDGGESISMVFSSVVRARGIAGAGENHLRL